MTLLPNAITYTVMNKGKLYIEKCNFVRTYTAILFVILSAVIRKVESNIVRICTQSNNMKE